MSSRSYQQPLVRKQSNQPDLLPSTLPTPSKAEEPKKAKVGILSRNSS